MHVTPVQYNSISLLSCMGNFVDGVNISTLKMNIPCSSKMSAFANKNTQCHKPRWSQLSYHKILTCFSTHRNSLCFPHLIHLFPAVRCVQCIQSTNQCISFQLQFFKEPIETHEEHLAWCQDIITAASSRTSVHTGSLVIYPICNQLCRSRQQQLKPFSNLSYHVLSAVMRGLLADKKKLSCKT